MKILFKTFLFASITALALSSCKPEQHKDIGEPRDVLSSIAGQWKLVKATQTDEDAKAKGFPFKEKDLTTLFPYTEFKLTLNLNGNTPGTFTTDPGASPRIIKLTSGNWAVDNADYPKEITLSSGAATEKIVLGGYPVGAANTLKLSVQRKDASSGKVLISYSYEFAKQ